MAWNDKQKLATAEAKLEILEKENIHLRKQVETLQEAIMSKLAPLAYMELKAAQDVSEDEKPISEELDQYKRDMKALGQYQMLIEKPFFDDKDDMIDKLTRVIGGPKLGKQSLHGNSES